MCLGITIDITTKTTADVKTVSSSGNSTDWEHGLVHVLVRCVCECARGLVCCPCRLASLAHSALPLVLQSPRRFDRVATFIATRRTGALLIQSRFMLHASTLGHVKGRRCAQ